MISVTRNYCLNSNIKTSRKKKTRTGLEILTPNKLLTTFPILLAQLKSGNNSYELKNNIRQILYLLQQQKKITKEVYNSLIKSL